jgi:hypothetical protein
MLQLTPNNDTGALLKSNKTLDKYRVPKRPTNYDFTHFDADKKNNQPTMAFFRQ